MSTPSKTLIARWETRGRKYWLELYEDQFGFSYQMDNGGGSMGYIPRNDALARVQGMVDDARKIDRINMQRVV